MSERIIRIAIAFKNGTLAQKIANHYSINKDGFIIKFIPFNVTKLKNELTIARHVTRYNAICVNYDDNDIASQLISNKESKGKIILFNGLNVYKSKRGKKFDELFSQISESLCNFGILSNYHYVYENGKVIEKKGFGTNQTPKMCLEQAETTLINSLYSNNRYLKVLQEENQKHEKELNKVRELLESLKNQK